MRVIWGLEYKRLVNLKMTIWGLQFSKKTMQEFDEFLP